MILFLVGLAIYVGLFYTVELPSLPRREPGGELWRRVDFVSLLLVPRELGASLAEQWFGEPPRFALLDRVGVLAAAVTILATGGVVGWLLLCAIGADVGLSPTEKVVFGLGVGLGTVSVYILLAGLLGIVSYVLTFAVPLAIVLAFAGRRLARLRARRLLQESGTSEKRVEGGRAIDAESALPSGKTGQAESVTSLLSNRWAWLAGPFVAAILLGGMLPPIEFDVREYHLQAPKEFFLAGRIEFLPHNVYANMPLGAEMHSLLGMVILGDWWLGALAGKTIISLFAPLTALALWSAGQRFFTPAVGVVAAVTYISIPWVVRVSTLGLIEGVLAFFLFAAFYSYWLWRDAHDTEVGGARLILCGLLTGFAVGCKYPALVFVFLPLLLAVWSTAGWRNWRAPIVFCAAALVASGLWFGKNWVLAGNPVYPLLGDVFGGDTRTAEKDLQWREAHRPRNYGGGDLAGRLAGYTMTSEWLSPLVVPLAALALFVRRHRRRVSLLVAMLAWYLATWWLFTHRLDRFWVASLPLAALLAGIGATWRLDRAWRRVLITLLSLTVAANLLLAVSPLGGYNRFFVPLARLRVDPNRVAAWHYWLNENVPEGAAVLAVGDAQVFDLEVAVRYNTVFDDSLFKRWVKGRSPQQVRDRAVEADVSHVYVHWGEIARYRSPGNYGFTDFVTPKLFDRLVADGVLERPVMEFSGPSVQIFPVRVPRFAGGGTAIEGPTLPTAGFKDRKQ